MLRLLFCIIELFSMLMTAFIGTCFYVGGFLFSLLYVFIRYVYRSVKGGARA